MIKIKDVLIINSYAGSLTVAATALGLKIRGSYEDCGYGLKTQRLNFPHLSYIEKLPWPGAPRLNAWHEPIPGSGQNLRETVVIAHPPCAGFSILNASSPHRQGLEGDHFQQTKVVLNYALGAQCAALLVESVPRALEGARTVHDAMAKQHGYALYRVLQNAATFGLPQWRERFWAIWVRNDLQPKKFVLMQKPVIHTLGDIIKLAPLGPENPWLRKRFNLQCDKILRSGGLTKQQLAEIISGEHVTGHLGQVIYRYLGRSYDYADSVKRFDLLKFDNERFWVHGPADFAPVITGKSTFTMYGRLLTAAEYNLIMGFPAEYQFDRASNQTTYLSKGVCPPVAQWLLGQTIENLENTTVKILLKVRTERVHALDPGGVANFLLNKRAALQREILWEDS